MKITNQKALTLNERQVCDLELILNGAFYPLKGFMNKSDYKSVLENMRLKNGTLWPMPITLDVSKNFSQSTYVGEEIFLKNNEGFTLATLLVSDIWKPDLELESKYVYETLDEYHPAINYIKNIGEEIYIGGEVKLVSYPKYYDFIKYRHTPTEIKKTFIKNGWDKIVAFQTRNPLHRAHIEMIQNAIKNLEAKLLIHPTVGPTKFGDVDHFTRVRCYLHVLKRFKKNTVILSLLPLAMRMGGPREALLHTIIRKNYGCTHFIVGRDHAGPGNDRNGEPFYGPYDAQDLIIKYQDEIGIEMVKFKFMVYIPKKDKYVPVDNVDSNMDFKTVSGTKLRKLLEDGKRIPNWFTYPDVARELKYLYPPLKKRGFTVFFTGLSGSGKSTLANGLLTKLMQNERRSVTLLDGDIVRTHLSSELGFSKKDRSINVRRIGYVASEITKNRGIAICAPIAPYTLDRKFNRDLISPLGGFVEIYVNTPLKMCEERDPKGLYKLARKGIVKEFTGISDPYEVPKNSEIVVDSSKKNPVLIVEYIYDKIKAMGYL